MSEYEVGLVRQYTDAISALGAKAQSGAEVTVEVRSAVAKHCEHFRILKSSRPAANLNAYRAALKMASHVTHESQPKVKATFDFALNVCPTEL